MGQGVGLGRGSLTRREGDVAGGTSQFRCSLVKSLRVTGKRKKGSAKNSPEYLGGRIFLYPSDTECSCFGARVRALAHSFSLALARAPSF